MPFMTRRAGSLTDFDILRPKMAEGGGPLPETEWEVVEAAREGWWWQVMMVLVGPPATRISLKRDVQRLVLEIGVLQGAWVFINHLVVKRYPFAPRTLDVVLLAAMRNWQLFFVESLIQNVSLQYDESLVLKIFLVFCRVPYWLPKAHIVLALLPLDMKRFRVFLLYYKKFLNERQRSRLTAGDMVKKIPVDSHVHSQS